MQTLSSYDGLITLNSLRLRFAYATVIPLLFFFGAVYFGLSNIYQQHKASKDEILGANAIRIFFKSVTDVQNIRGLSQIVLQNSSPEIELQIDKAKTSLIERFNDPYWNFICEHFSIEAEAFHIRKEMERLVNNANANANANANTNAEDVFSYYSRLIDKMRVLMLVIANRSSLILDPEIDTYYLMELVVKDIPHVDEAVGKLRGLGSGIIAGGEISREDVENIKAARYVLEDNIDDFNHVNSVIKQSVPLLSIVSLLITVDHESDMNKFLGSLDKFNKPGRPRITAKEFFQYGTKVMNNYTNLHHINTDLLIKKLEKRVLKHQYKMVITVVMSIFSIFAVFYFSLKFYRQEKNSIQNLEKMTITDPLTLIPNRRYMDIVFQRELQRARRDKRGFAFGIFDIDFFKQYNDTYGHKEGDNVLRQVSVALSESLQRGSDYYFRYGGEEFCFMIYPTSLEDARASTELIRANIDNLGIEHKQSSVSSALTISLGLVFINKVKNENMDFILNKADELMYKCKDKGRDQYMVETIEQ